MKFKYFVVYENISDKFDNGHCRIKVKVTVENFFPFTTIQTVGFYNSPWIEGGLYQACMFI